MTETGRRWRRNARALAVLALTSALAQGLAQGLALWLGLALGPLSADVRAQAGSGRIAGTVLDPTSAIIPGADVALRGDRTGAARTTVTDANGTFAFADLLPDVYTVTASMAGFKTTRRTGVVVSGHETVRVDFHFELDAPMVVLDEGVWGMRPLLQTDTAETGETIVRAQMEGLPLLGRSLLDLTRLAPGTTRGQGGNNVNLSVNGQREFANAMIVDGIEVTGNRNNDTNLRPALEAVDELKIITSGYAPEYGRAAGGVIAMQMRAGTNFWHGSASEFVRPTGTAARTFFATEPSSLKQHTFGGTFGGPIRRNKLFVFAAYEGIRLHDRTAYLDSVPPQDQIRFLPNGDVDLSNLRDPSTGAVIPVFDPAAYATTFTPRQFPGNVIPAARVSPAGRAILQQLFPRPNREGLSNGWFNNFAVDQRYAYDSDTADMRVDRTIRESHRITGIYHLATFDSQQDDRFGAAIPISGGGAADDGDRTASRNHSASVTWNAARPDWFVEARGALNDFRLTQRSLAAGDGLATRLGLGGIDVPGFPASAGLPFVSLGFGAYTGGSTFKPLRFHDRQVQMTSSLTLLRGPHTMKAGVDVRRLSARPDFSLFPTGFMYFGGPFQSLTSDPNFSYYDPSAFYATGGSDVADLLLGLPSSVSLGLQLTAPQTRSWETHAYAQDTWRIANTVTLIYGVRYEYQAPYEARDGQAANFDPQALQLRLGEGLVRADRNNLAPRVGATWQIGDTVVRGAWGLFYSPENDARSDILTKNYPFAVRQDIANSVFDGLPFAYVLDVGIPRQTRVTLPSGGTNSLGIADVPNARNQAFYVVDPSFRTGYAHLFNVVVQHALTPKVGVEVGYVGALGRDLPYAIGNLNRDDRLSNRIGRVEGQFAVGENAYHSLQAKVTRRYANDFSLLASYTYGKALDNGPAPFNLGRNNQQPQEAFNLDAEWGPSANDVRHTVTGSAMYRVPCPSIAGAVCHVLGDWQLATIVQARSGTPFNVVRNASNQAAPGLRPNLLHDPELPRGDRTLTRYFDTTAFSAAGLGATAPGTAGRNILRGPGYVNVDLSLAKTIRATTTLSAELRIEAFNLTNTPHFANPHSDLSRGSFGTVTQTTGNARILQFAARLTF